MGNIIFVQVEKREGKVCLLQHGTDSLWAGGQIMGMPIMPIMSFK